MSRFINPHILQLMAVLVFVTSCSRTPVRNDLKGKPLVSDDFSFVIGSQYYPSFEYKDSVESTFPGGVWIQSSVFRSSENPDMPVRADIKTEEYITDEVRFVFFEGIYHEIRNGKNGFTGLKNNSRTIRGIKVGASIDDVFKAYGKTAWVKEHEEAWYSGWLMFTYRYYYNTELDGEVQELYDCIEFEIHDGIVVGIYYHFMNSDGI